MVKIVGAGPGAKDLITVRGMKLLNEADVIIYAGSLVNEELLEYAKETCEIYNSSDVGIPFSSGNEAFALMFPYFRFFESIIDVNRAHGLRTNF